METLTNWVREARVQFLSLSVALIFLGSSIGFSEGRFDLINAILALIGLMFLHVSVNALNDYEDYKSGIDFNTEPTPFSGGSGMLTQGKIEPASAYMFGIFCLAMGGLIGLYLMWMSGFWLLPIMLIGGFATYFYTTVLARRMLGEIFAGLGLGLLPVMGAAYIQLGYYPPGSIAAGLVAGVLTFNLLLLNEFPDYEADLAGGRQNLLTCFGKEASGKVYTGLMVIMYIWIIMAVALDLAPAPCLVALFTIPLALKPMGWAWSNTHADDEIRPALAGNVMTNIGTQVLLGMGFIMSVYI
jgi:1,4-dihydroxy-2-naphthoate octaprenyltransferase